MTNQEAIEDIEKNILPVVGGKSLLMAISALQAQEAKAQLSEEGTTSDLISRQDAIEVIEEMQMPIMRSMFPEEQFVFKGMSEALSAIKDLPSAQPEPLVKESRTLVKDLVKDTISRQAAIDAECEVCQIAPKKERGHNCTYYVHGCKEIECLRALPSAHPEIEERKEESAQNVPKEDLISRKAAIDAMSESLKRVFPEHRQIAEKCLKALPPAQSEPQWIPVSERMPGENEFVIVTFGWFGRKTDPGVNIDEIRDGDWMISEVVTAWMPLPEPYREERRTDDLQ